MNHKGLNPAALAALPRPLFVPWRKDKFAALAERATGHNDFMPLGYVPVKLGKVLFPRLEMAAAVGPAREAAADGPHGAPPIASGPV